MKICGERGGFPTLDRRSRAFGVVVGGGMRKGRGGGKLRKWRCVAAPRPPPHGGPPPPPSLMGGDIRGGKNPLISFPPRSGGGGMQGGGWGGVRGGGSGGGVRPNHPRTPPHPYRPITAVIGLVGWGLSWKGKDGLLWILFFSPISLMGCKPKREVEKTQGTPMFLLLLLSWAGSPFSWEAHEATRS
nr:hypothetical protein [Morchella crassipes]